MLTALPTLPVQLKSDPAPASAPKPGATVAGDNSFASLIRRQAEQRLDALRLADQQALAARVSAAAAIPLARPMIEPLASRPPLPAQTTAERSPPKAAPSAPAAPANANANATANAQASSAPPGPAPARPAQASTATARAKAAGTAGHTDTARSATARSGQADSAAAGRASRERKPGAASGAEASADDPATAGLPGLQAGLPLDVLPVTDLPPGLSTLPAEQAGSEPVVPADATAVASDGTVLPERRPDAGQAQTAADGIAADASRRPVPGQLPGQALAARPVAESGDAASPASPRARIGGARRLQADPGDPAGGDLALRPGDLPRPVDQVSAPAVDSLEDRRRRGPAGPDMPLARPDAITAAALPGAGRTAWSSAADANPGGSADDPAAGRRAASGVDRRGPEPEAAGATQARPALARPANIDGLSAAAVPKDQQQPTGAAPQGFDGALQTLLAQGTAPTGATAGAAPRSAAAPVALQIDAPVDSPLFAPSLGSQLSLLARDGVRSALLQLHPAEMGPISVEIALNGNAAHIDFQALRADTRGLIEASLPALAGALQDAGLTLAGGGVFEQASGRQPQAQAQAQTGQGPGARPAGTADNGPAGPLDSPQPARRTAPRGLVDLVA